MDKSNFDQLMQRYLEGKASDQERAKIEAWLDVLKTKNTTDLELSESDEEKLFQKITSVTSTVSDVVAIAPKPGNKGIRLALQIAAVLLVVMVASSIVANYFNHGTAPLQVTSQNGIEKIILTDGTIVWLQGGSKLSYYKENGTGTRNTEFEGEALFEVAKDASHPFIIKCGDVSLKVLGTSFSLKSKKDSLKLSVLTGRVNLTSLRSSVNVDVDAHEKVTFANRGIVRAKLDSKEVPALTANTEYKMLFNNTPMADVYKMIGKKFNVQINVASQVARCKITADFTDHSLESTLQLIKEVLNIDYAENEGIITITGAGCN